jgi:creatinine deaminase
MRGTGILGKGHNQRVQKGDFVAHGEMDCIRNARRQRSYRDTVFYTTLSRSMMSSGTIVHFRIPRFVIGESRSVGGNEEFVRSRGAEVAVLDDPKCKALMGEFVRSSPQVWSEDIGKV